MSRDLITYLEDIKLGCIKIQKYIVGMSLDIFMEDDKTIDAVTRNVEIIGEAAKKVPMSFRNKHPEIEWRYKLLECVMWWHIIIVE